MLVVDDQSKPTLFGITGHRTGIVHSMPLVMCEHCPCSFMSSDCIWLTCLSQFAIPGRDSPVIIEQRHPSWLLIRVKRLLKESKLIEKLRSQHQQTIGLYRENAIAIESEARDPFGGNVYYVTMQITFPIPEFARKERNLHCDVVHVTTKWVSRLVLDHAIAAIQTSR